VERRAGPRGGGFELQGGSVFMAADQPVLGTGRERRSVGFGDPLVQQALARAAPARPPRQGVQKLKCAGS